MKNIKSIIPSFLITCAALLSTGCLDQQSSGVTPTLPPEAEPTEVDVKAIVSVGAGLNFNNQTGSWSELAIDPVLKTPGIVYYDRSAVVSPVIGALKFASMDEAGSWQIEVIDANAPVTANTNTCGGGATTAACIGAPNVAVPTASQAQMYDVKYLVSNNESQAVVAYAYGTGGTGSSISGKAIRFAVRASDGSWDIETAVSGVQIAALTTGGVGPQLLTLEYPIKGLRLLVDDSNRVHLYFAIYSSTQNNSVYAYTMRSAAGVWTAPVVVTTTAPSTLSFVSGAPTYVAGTGMNQAGAAWCKYNTGGSSTDGVNAILTLATLDNSPAASTQGFILRCSAANSDGSCSTWQGLDFHAGCSGACITTTPASTATATNSFSRSDLAIDPVSGKIFLSEYFTAPTLTVPMAAASGILSTQSPAACDAGLSSTAWATVRGYPNAAQGGMGLRVAADGTNFYMASLVAAAGTSIVLNKQSSALAANWNTSPDQITIEATTNTIGGGFAYDASTETLWGTYGALTAAAAGVVGQDLKAYAALSSDIATTGFIPISYVDQTNFVSSATAVPMLDAAIAPNGNVGYAYYYQEQGAAPGANSRVYYGVRGGSALSPVFGEKVVSNAIQGATTFTNGLHPSLSYDSRSNPAITFLDNGVAANTGFLTLARSSNNGVSFSLERVDGSTVTTNTVGQFTSLDFSSADTVGISYYDYSTGATGQRLKFAKRTKNGAWRKYIVDGPGSANTNGCSTTGSATTGLYSQFSWTSDGRPVIVYQGQVAGIKSLRLAYATEAESSATYTWTCLTLDTALQGSNIRGEGIDFFLAAGDLPYIAHYDSTIGALRVVTCPSGGSVLTCAQAGASAFSGERLNYILGTVTSIASKPSIRVTDAGKIWVAFHGSADRGLFIAAKSAGAWDVVPKEIEATPENIGSTFTGQHGVMLLNSNDEPMLFYRSYENWLKYFSREFSAVMP